MSGRMTAVLGKGQPGEGDAGNAPVVPAAFDPLAGEAAAGPPPRLSVVVPTCGRHELLLRCLMALLAQTLERAAFEIVVVDDAHDDLTRTLVTAVATEPAAPAVRYVCPRSGRGPAVARNAGWHVARGEIVAFTDDDTIPATDWLEQGEAAMRSQPQCSALGGRVVVPLPAESLAAPTDHERMTQGLERTEFVTANAFVRRAALAQVQGFDERFTRAWREDSDLQFRLDDAAGPVGRCETALVQHPTRPERWGLSLRQQKNAFFEALLYAKHPRRYQQQVGLPVPWNYYAIVALTVAAIGLAAARVWGSAGVCVALVLALVLRFAWRRLQGASHRAAHVVEMLATSALIPYLSVYWRLRGALHFRVWFV